MKRYKYFIIIGCLVVLLVILMTAYRLSGALLRASEETYAEAQFIIETVVVEKVAIEVEEPAEEVIEHGDDTRIRALQAPVPQTQRMVIKDAEMELLVDNTDIAVAKVTQIAGDYGGYIISAQTFLKNQNKFATIRIGVPSGNFETVLNNLRNVGIKVIQETASGKDVTAEYIDLESRLENLEATAARVRTFLEAAETVEEALKVNQELSKLEQEIEQIKGQMRFYEGRSAFSTISVSLKPQLPTPTPTLTPTPTPTLTPTPGWNPLNTLEDSTGVLETLVKVTINVLIWLVVIVGPFALVALIIFLIGRWIWKRTRKPAQTEAQSQAEGEE
jgi:hypothetical protein